MMYGMAFNKQFLSDNKQFDCLLSIMEVYSRDSVLREF